MIFLFLLFLLWFSMFNNPSVTFGDSSLYTREPFTSYILRSPFVCFHSSAIASFEPRDYRVVFVLQKGNIRTRLGGYCLLYHFAPFA